MRVAMPDLVASSCSAGLARANDTVGRKRLLLVALGCGLLIAVLLSAVRPGTTNVLTLRSGSMMPTLLVGDQVRMEPLPLSNGSSGRPLSNARMSVPVRGEAIVFRSDDGSGHLLIKRVIGLPGDRVEIRNGTVLINGDALARLNLSQPESRALADRLGLPGPPDGATWERLGQVRYQILLGHIDDVDSSENLSCLVPAGHLFVLGDNRGGSIDSRHWGPITLDRVLGRIRPL